MPFALEWAFVTGGINLLITLYLIHNLLIGCSPSAIYSGTTTIGLAHGETLLVMTPAFPHI